MYTILTFSYLVLPLFWVVFPTKRKIPEVALLAIYGLIAFLYLYFDEVPNSLKPLYAISFTTIEYLSFAVLMLLSVSSKRLKSFILILTSAFIVFQVAFYFAGEVNRLDSIPVGIESILLFMIIFMFLYETFKDVGSNEMPKQPNVLLAAGILLYLGIAFFFFIIPEYLFATKIDVPEIDRYWFVTYIAEFVKNLLFALAVIKFTRRSSDNFSAPPSHPSIPHLI